MALNKSFNPRADYPYTEYTDQHYMDVDYIHDITFDKDYPYIDNSKSFRFKQWWVHFVLFLVVYPVARIRFGLKIRGKKNIRKNRKLLKNGAISICNHIHRWDYIIVMSVLKPRKPHVLVWDKNVNSKDGPLVRLVGGVPIPQNDSQATIAYLDTIKNYLNNGGWLHIYPEGSMWEYYRYIRPFKKGIAHLARMCDKPIVPFAISYRKPGWIRRAIFKQKACFNFCIGEPIFLNKNLTGPEQEVDLVKRCHLAVTSLAGLTEEENVYEPIFNNSKRIDF